MYPKFISVGGRGKQLYMARRNPDNDGPSFVLELDIDDLGLVLLSLSEMLPDGEKLVEHGEITDEARDAIRDVGDSVRELLMRATSLQHNHVWHCLAGPEESGDEAAAKLALAAYRCEIEDENYQAPCALEIIDT